MRMRMMTAPMFGLLGVDAHVGRTFRADEDRAGASPVAILSYGLWQRQFGGAADAIGKAIDLDSRPYTIVGVMPAGFELLQPADVFLPFTPWAVTLPDDRNWHPGIIVIGRLKPGVTREQAGTEMLGITKRLEQQYPEYNTGTSADVIPLQAQMVQGTCGPALMLLLGAVTFVLLIACANVANLLLARVRLRADEGSRDTHIDGGDAGPRDSSIVDGECVAVARGRRAWLVSGAVVAWAAAENLGWLCATGF